MISGNTQFQRQCRDGGDVMFLQGRSGGGAGNGTKHHAEETQCFIKAMTAAV
jgi:hypothetical protein